MNHLPDNLPLITVLGPTASGKTQFAAQLATYIDAEIISADSRQIYRGMDIGTGKDLSDYRIAGNQIPYHLIERAEIPLPMEFWRRVFFPSSIWRGTG